MPSPPVNRSAIWDVRRSTAGTIPAGRGVVLTGSFGPDGAALIATPAGADAQIHGVTFEADPDDVNVGRMLQAGMSNARLKIGTAPVSLRGPAAHPERVRSLGDRAGRQRQRVLHRAAAGSRGGFVLGRPRGLAERVIVYSGFCVGFFHRPHRNTEIQKHGNTSALSSR